MKILLPPYSVSGVYKITCLKNGKIYIGSSTNLRKRMLAHARRLRSGIHDNIHLQRAYEKYGHRYFLIEVVEIVEGITAETVQVLLDREQVWIDFWHAADFKCGYNIAPIAGSNAGVKKSEEAKAKDRENLAKIRAQPGWGEKISTQFKKLWSDPDWRKRQTDKIRSSQTKESRQKRSEISKKQWEDPEYKERILNATLRKYNSDPAVIAKREESAKRREVEKALAWKTPYPGNGKEHASKRFLYLWALDEYRQRVLDSLRKYMFVIVNRVTSEIVVTDAISEFAEERKLNKSHVVATSTGRRIAHKDWVATRIKKSDFNLLDEEEKIGLINDAVIKAEKADSRKTISEAQKKLRADPTYKQKRLDSDRKFIYTLTDRKGDSFETDDLRGFCKERGLIASHLYAVCNGKKRKSHKGWTATKRSKSLS